MRSRLAAVLLACGVLGLCLAVSADDRKEREREREREGDRRKRPEGKKGAPKPGDAKPADPKPADAAPADAKPADAKAAKAPSFKTDVAPLLSNACASCHSGLKRKAGLDVESYASIMKFVTAGAPEKSKLHNSLIGKGAKPMPPKNPLSEEQVGVIKAWIAAGAKKD